MRWPWKWIGFGKGRDLNGIDWSREAERLWKLTDINGNEATLIKLLEGYPWPFQAYSNLVHAYMSAGQPDMAKILEGLAETIKVGIDPEDADAIAQATAKMSALWAEANRAKWAADHARDELQEVIEKCQNKKDRKRWEGQS